MRIISGKYGRRRFDVPSSFSARPTTDLAKENLFNVLSNLIDFEDLDALDLFAGTGSISFELLSRGCKSVTSIEKNNAHATFISKVVKELKDDNIHIIKGDVFRFLKNAATESFDFIFARKLLRQGGIFVMEHPASYDFSQLPFFDQHRVYGAVNFSIFINREEPDLEQGGEKAHE